MNNDFPTFWQWLKELWQTDRWFFYLAFAFSGCVGVFTYCLLIALQR